MNCDVIEYGSSSRATNLVFFGTPGYAVPTLRALNADPGFEVQMVVTQPDRPAGRGHSLVASPVKRAALELDLRVLQPETLRDDTIRETLRNLDADLFVVAAYGLIFGTPILDMPRYGCVNLHASILPAFRGAAPVTAAILTGESYTGVALMEMERGLDTGAVISVIETAILPSDTTEVLTTRLANLGADLAVEALPRFVKGELRPVPQSGQATIVRQLIKADGEIDWMQPAEAIERHVRAMWPWPRAWTRSSELTVQVHQVHVAAEGYMEPGTVGIVDKSIAVGTKTSPLIVDLAQLPGGRPISGQDLATNPKLRSGLLFDRWVAPEVPLIRAAD